MALQYFIAGLIILVALGFAGRAVIRRSRSFSVKSGCDADCGCGGKSKKLSS